MVSNSELQLDLQVAWKRYRLDHPHRVFVEHPFENLLIEQNLDEWLGELNELITNGRYSPAKIFICDVPKGRGAIRPGAYIGARDAVIYCACVGACFPSIFQALQWSQERVDFSYQLPTSPLETKWIRSEFTGWNSFQRQTIELVNSVTHVVFADITGYYENIDLSLLSSDLRQVGAPMAAISVLSTCLNKWAEVPSRGIPQGYAPSDILGKLYLNTIDEHLREKGNVHLRYVDDFRLFCKSESEARRAQLELTRLLRKRGLCLQTAKTEILTSAEARSKIEAVRSTLLEIRLKLSSNVEAAIDSGDPYVFGQIDEDVLNDDLESDVPPLQAVHDAFFEHFASPCDTDVQYWHTRPFDKTLFHFLLNRLGQAKDRFAVTCCLKLLAIVPEETGAICTYLIQISRIADHDEDLLAFLTSDSSIYNYQIYQIIRSRMHSSAAPSDGLLAFIRKLVFTQHPPAYLLATARNFLGEFGTKTDLERLEDSYGDERGALEQIEIMCCLKRMEKQRRNAFVSRYAGDSDLHKRASKHVKQM